MESTCTKDCKFWKKYKDKCPFYIQTTWSKDGEPTPRVVEDCTPKRSMILIMEMSNRFLGLQQATEQERNMQHRVVEKLIQMQNDSMDTINLVDCITHEEEQG
jgi:hypothetical protein